MSLETPVGLCVDPWPADRDGMGWRLFLSINPKALIDPFFVTNSPLKYLKGDSFFRSAGSFGNGAEYVILYCIRMRCFRVGKGWLAGEDSG